MHPRLAHSHLLADAHASADHNDTYREPDAHARAEPRADFNSDGHAPSQRRTDGHIHVSTDRCTHTDTIFDPEQHADGNRHTHRHGDRHRKLNQHSTSDWYAHADSHGNTGTD